MAHILVVDDEPQIRSMLRLLLTESGYEVSEAEDGNEALRITSTTRIDVIILDLIMPGKEGLETLMALRREKKSPKVIVVSGGAKSVSTDFLPIAQKLGADRTLKKPFHNEDLLAAIQELL